MFRFALRLVAVAVVILALVQPFALVLVRVELRPMRAEVAALGADYRVMSLDLGREGPSSTVRLRANLRQPIYVHGRWVLPFGRPPFPPGFYQINLDARGVLQAPLIFLIAVLSWPVIGAMQMLARLFLAVPTLGVLLALDAPLELLGNLQEAVARQWHLEGLRPLFVWDKFLEGGGNAVLALVLAVCVITWSRGRRPADAALSQDVLHSSGDAGVPT